MHTGLPYDKHCEWHLHKMFSKSGKRMEIRKTSEKTTSVIWKTLLFMTNEMSQLVVFNMCVAGGEG